jgi:hypothetical protein
VLLSLFEVRCSLSRLVIMLSRVAVRTPSPVFVRGCPSSSPARLCRRRAVHLACLPIDCGCRRVCAVLSAAASAGAVWGGARYGGVGSGWYFLQRNPRVGERESASVSSCDSAGGIIGCPRALAAAEADVLHVCVSRNNQFIACATRDGWVVVWCVGDSAADDTGATHSIPVPQQAPASRRAGAGGGVARNVPWSPIGEGVQSPSVRRTKTVSSGLFSRKHRQVADGPAVLDAVGFMHIADDGCCVVLSAHPSARVGDDGARVAGDGASGCVVWLWRGASWNDDAGRWCLVEPSVPMRHRHTRSHRTLAAPATAAASSPDALFAPADTVFVSSHALGRAVMMADAAPNVGDLSLSRDMRSALGSRSSGVVVDLSLWVVPVAAAFDASHATAASAAVPAFDGGIGGWCVGGRNLCSLESRRRLLYNVARIHVHLPCCGGCVFSQRFQLQRCRERALGGCSGQQRRRRVHTDGARSVVHRRRRRSERCAQGCYGSVSAHATASDAPM